VFRIRNGFGKDPDLDTTFFFRVFQEAPKKLLFDFLFLFDYYLPIFTSISKKTPLKLKKGSTNFPFCPIIEIIICTSHCYKILESHYSEDFRLLMGSGVQRDPLTNVTVPDILNTTMTPGIF
jgi:hypothetical protein